MKEEITKSDLVSDIRAAGVSEGDLLNIKGSMKSIGWVKGGPATVVDALLEAVGPEGTLVTDAFVPSYPLPLSEDDRRKVNRPDTPSYAGALANIMVTHPESWRSPHPIQKFAAIGKRAEELTQGFTIDCPAYGLLSVMAETGGKNFKIGDDVQVPGVGTTHVVIERLGIKRNRLPQGAMWERPDGTEEFFKIFWAGGCWQAWLKFYPEYKKVGAVLGSGTVGKGPSLLTDMAKTLNWEAEALERDPTLLLCGRSSCRTCYLEWEFSTGSKLVWALKRLWNRVCNLVKRSGDR